jgi:hypothetical protein
LKVTVLCAAQNVPSVSWLAVDELAELLANYYAVGVTYLTPRESRKPWSVLTRSGRYRKIDCQQGDVLFVIAGSPGDLDMVNAIKSCRQKFTKIIGIVTDSYFYNGYGNYVSMYDCITVTEQKDAEFVAQKFGVTTQLIYQGIDTLRWMPRREYPRDIDFISYGRTPASYHSAFVTAFHSVSSDSLYLHSPIGNIKGPTVHAERTMLFKLLQRSKISLAFNLLIEPNLNRPVSMMVTSRWLESLISGCLVVGKRPISPMADAMLNWDGCTIELVDSPHDAVEQLISLTHKKDSWHHQRVTNIKNMMLQHDWRYRIHQICTLNAIELPSKLEFDIQKVMLKAASM